jgi:O-methyltransferase
MREEDYRKLFQDLEEEILKGAKSVGVLGLTGVTLQLIESLATAGLLSVIEAVYTFPSNSDVTRLTVPVRPFEALAQSRHDLLVVASDEQKERFLTAALPFVKDAPKVIVSGYKHLTFRDRDFVDASSQLLVPSLANGYPNTLVHLYQCLVNAARLGLHGVVAEFGMFKGGTTMFLSRVVERLRMDWPVIGFDTFAGFPPRRSLLDMYSHEECVFTDLPAVRRYLEGRNIEIIPGDIIETCHRLDHEDIVLSFIDTDNYTPAKAAIDVVKDRTVVGGAIVFDHFTGVDRFRYTLGERMAGASLVSDSRYFHLHGTGVFYRQR